MLHAKKLQRDPEVLIEETRQQHLEDFSAFDISFDNYHSTHSPENRELVERIFAASQNHIERRAIDQLYDPELSLFLADRYVLGNCPRCAAPDQYGDCCEQCGATYAATELGQPRSAMSNATPLLRSSDHYFFRLSDLADELRTWVARGVVQPAAANKLREWLEGELQDWDISRDAPYFGFEIPSAPGKYFYVWLDATIGYMASHLHWCRARGDEAAFAEVWAPDSDTELYHFIGKDIMYFHTLFWPALLHAAEHRLPNAVFMHGFLTVNGEKMSKSRGTFITAAAYRQHLDTSYLRYYFACRLEQGLDDLDINIDDFIARVNADLVGKIVNIASRCAGFVHRHGGGQLSAHLSDPELWESFSTASEEIAAEYEHRRFGRAMRKIMALADRANQYIDAQRPWQLAKHLPKSENNDAHITATCSLGLNLFRLLVMYLKPVLPRLAEQTEAFLRIPPLQWSDAQHPLLDTAIDPFQPMVERIDPEQVAQMMAAIGDSKAGQPPTGEPMEVPDYIEYEDFVRLDLRVARIVRAEEIEGADKLLRLELDLGDQTRRAFAGIRQAYRADELAGKLVVVVANLKPRTMRFGISETMVLAAGPGGEELWLVSPADGATPGMQVK